MNWPTSQDYNEAVQDAANNFADPTMQSGEVVVNALGLPVPRSGNFADVYQFKDGNGRMWALKCFTRKVPGLHERYLKIDEHLEKHKLPFTVGFKFMEEGIRVKGHWFPLLKMEWVEGFTLNDFVAENLTKPNYLHALVQMWAKLAGRLRDANMSHADLQHGNVLLVPGATPQKLGLKLIDYDGMWVPALSDSHSGEVGHPNFQHPLRLKDRLYNGDVDRFPHLVVAAGLRATLVGGKAIWDRFDNSDNLIFKETDLRDPARAAVFKALWDLNDPVLRTLVGHIALASKQPLRKTPWLDDVLFAEGGPKLTDDEEKQVCELLGVSKKTAVTDASRAPAKVEQSFNVFDFFDQEDSIGPATTRPGRKPAASDKNDKKSKNSKKAKEPEKKSLLPFYIGGGVAAFVLLIVGVIVAVSLGGKKKDVPPEIAQNKEDPKAKGSGRDTNPKKDPEIKKDPEAKKDPEIKKDPEEGKLPPKINRPLPPFPPLPVGPEIRTPTIGVAPLPGEKSYLTIRQGSPTIYGTIDFLGRTVYAVGSHTSPINTLTLSSDGKRAITGTQEGDVGLWSLKKGEAYIEPRDRMKTLIGKFGKMELFQSRYSHDAFQEGVIVYDHTTGKEQIILAGKPEGHTVNVVFRRNLQQELGKFGEAITDEVKLFDGNLIAQVFEGGTQFYYKPVDKSLYFWHAKRTAPKDNPVAKDTPTPPDASPLKTLVFKTQKMDGFKRPYEITAYREGLLIRDTGSNKEVILRPGAVANANDPAFNGLFSYERLNTTYGTPLTLPTDIFDGALRVVLCSRGYYLNQTGTTRNYNASSGKDIFDAVEPAKNDTPKMEPPKGEATPQLKNKIHGPFKIIMDEYEYTLFREGVSVRQLKTGKEATVMAGAVLPEVKGPFKPGKVIPGTPFEHAVTEAVELFDGVLYVQLFRGGVRFQEKDNPTRRYGFNAGLEADIGGAGETPRKPALPELSGTTLKEHDGPVVASAIAPDGTRAVTVGKDGLLCEWDLVTPKLLRKFKVPEPSTVAYLPDGKSVILGTVSESASVWNLAGSRRVAELPGHTSAVLSVCVAPNGTIAWTGSEDGTIHAWALTNFKQAGNPSQAAQGLRALAVSPDGRLFACVVADGGVFYYNAKNGQLAGQSAGIKTSGFALAFINDTELVVGRDIGPIRIRVNIADAPKAPVPKK